MAGLLKRMEKLEKRKKSKRKDRDESLSDDESSHASASSTDSENELDKLKRKKEKKLNKDTKLMVNSPFAVAIKKAINRDPARSRAVEAAFIARTARPRTTTINMIYKDVSRVKWDHPALEASFGAQMNSELVKLQNKSGEKYKQKHALLKAELSELRDLLEQDRILINAQALFIILDSLTMRNTNMIGLLDAYKEVRKSFLSIPDNLSLTIGRVHGFCFGYNLRMEGCKNTNCSYWHFCFNHQSKKLAHPFMKCPDNSNRWTDKEVEQFNNRSKGGYNNKPQRYRKYDRRRNYDDNYKDFDRRDEYNDRGYDKPRGNRKRYRGGRR